MLLYLSLLGFLLAGILIVYTFYKHQSSRFLAVFFILVSFYKLNEYIILYSGSIFWNAVISSNFTFLYYLIGPFFFFYIRSVVHPNRQFTNRDFLHFIPSFIFLIALIPYISTTYSYKQDIAQQIVNNPKFLISFKPTILSHWTSVSFVYFSRPMSILAYTFYSLWIFLNYEVERVKYPRSNQDRLMRNWLAVLFLVVWISFVSHWAVVNYAFQNDISILYAEGDLFLQFCSLSFSALIICPLLFPHILYGIGITIPTQQPDLASPNTEEPKSEFVTPLEPIDREYYDQIASLIDTFLADQKSFLRQGYNMNQLADDLKLPVSHLSYFFREIKRQNFTDFKNELRVKYACQLILDEKFKGMTLEAIGLESGFSSRITFIRAFKKVTNQTPGNYKAVKLDDGDNSM